MLNAIYVAACNKKNRYNLKARLILIQVPGILLYA